MTILAPVEVVRLALEARAARDVRELKALVDPAVSARFAEREGRRVEVDAHRIEPLDDEHVRVTGRVRVMERGTLTDSPGAWLFTVRNGRIVDVESADPARPRGRAPLRRVA